MKVIFKKINNSLKEEGITLDLLHNIQSLTVNLPAMIEKGDDPVNLIKANDKGFWVVFPDLTYLRDEKGIPILIPIKEVIIGRARCYLHHKDELIKKAVESEVNKIKGELVKVVLEKAKDFNRLYMAAFGRRYFDVNYSGLDFQMMSIIQVIQQSEGTQLDHETAVKILNEHPQYLESVEYLYNALKNEDFDSLYMVLKTKGLPELFKAKHNAKDLDVLKEFFHADKIEGTIEMLSNNSHLYNAALMKVTRLYSVA